MSDSRRKNALETMPAPPQPPDTGGSGRAIHKKKAWHLLLAALSVTIATILFFAFTKANPLFIEVYFVPFSVSASTSLAAFFGIFPFCAGELLVVFAAVYALLAVAFTIYCLLRRKPYRTARLWSATLLACSLLVFAFYALWGVCYARQPIAEREGFEAESRQVSELFDAALFFLTEAEELAPYAARDADGSLLPADIDAAADDTAKAAGVYYTSSGLNCAKDTSPVKTIMSSGLLTHMGITGIYFPFTGESNINTMTPASSMAFTMAHELAHRHGTAREDEANFEAVLICRASEDKNTAYSASFMAFSYCSAALYSADYDLWVELWTHTGEYVWRDVSDYNMFWQKYEGKTRETASKINDTYLKAQGLDDGVKSYGKVVDLLIEWYIKNQT